MKDEAILHVVDCREMQIFVKTPDGKTITLNVVPSLTIKILRKMLKQNEGTPIKEQFLVMGK